MGLISVAILGAIAFAAIRAMSAANPRPPASGGGQVDPAAAVDPWLARWTDAELLTADQADAIRAHERAVATPAPPPREVHTRSSRVPVVAEAIGYLGGSLAIVGLLLVLDRFWPDLSFAGRLSLTGAMAVGLLVGGGAIDERDDPALARLRWSLWFLATAAAGVFAGIAVADGIPTDAPETISLGGSTMVLVFSAALWRGRDRPVQQLTTVAAAVATAAWAVAMVAEEAPVGVTIWIVGVAILATGVTKVTTVPVINEGVGSLAVVFGAGVVSSDATSFGLLFLTGTALALCALATVPGIVEHRHEQIVIGLVGALALVQTSGPTIGWFSEQAGGLTGLVTWGVAGTVGFAAASIPLRLTKPIQLVSGLFALVGAGVTGTEWPSVAPLFGIATAVALVALGMLPGQVPLSVLGSVGLLVFVPWAIGWFFPGENQAPVLIMVTGTLLIALAILLTRPRTFRRQPRH